jgi:hypothetical protein
MYAKYLCDHQNERKLVFWLYWKIGKMDIIHYNNKQRITSHETQLVFSHMLQQKCVVWFPTMYQPEQLLLKQLKMYFISWSVGKVLHADSCLEMYWCTSCTLNEWNRKFPVKLVQTSKSYTTWFTSMKLSQHGHLISLLELWVKYSAIHDIQK